MSLENIITAVSGKGGPLRGVELGKIKIGGLGEVRKTAQGKLWRMPRKDDCFTVTGLARNKTGDLETDEALMKQLIEEYGDTDGKLRQIPIRLLSDDIDKVLTARFCWYGKRTCGAWSDGENVTWRYDPQTMKPLNPPIVQQWTPEIAEMVDAQGKPLFKLHANFQCTIHSKAGRWGGAYVFRTTSVISFRQLYSSLLEISDKTGGVLVGMPLFLVVRPMLVAPDGNATNVYVVHVEVRGKELEELQKMALERRKFRLECAASLQAIDRRYQKLLLAPGDEPDDEAARIADEFVPDDEPDDSIPVADPDERPDFVVPKSITETTRQLNDLLVGDVGERLAGGAPVTAAPQADEPRRAEPEPEVTDAPCDRPAAAEAAPVATDAPAEAGGPEAVPSAQDAAWAGLLAVIEHSGSMAEITAAVESYQGVWGVTDDEQALIDSRVGKADDRIKKAQRAADWTETLAAIEAAETQEAITTFAGGFRKKWGLTGDEARVLNDTVRTAWARVTPAAAPAGPETAAAPASTKRPSRSKQNPQGTLPGV